MTDIDLAWDIFSRLQRNYPLWPSTFGLCCKCGVCSARGGGKCPSCLEDELAELVGEDLAIQAVVALRDTQMAWAKIRERLEQSRITEA